MNKKPAEIGTCKNSAHYELKIIYIKKVYPRQKMTGVDSAW